MTTAPPVWRGRFTLTRQPGWGSSQLQPTAQHCDTGPPPNCRCPGRYAAHHLPVTTPKRVNGRRAKEALLPGARIVRQLQPGKQRPHEVPIPPPLSDPHATLRR